MDGNEVLEIPLPGDGKFTRVNKKMSAGKGNEGRNRNNDSVSTAGSSSIHSVIKQVESADTEDNTKDKGASDPKQSDLLLMGESIKERIKAEMKSSVFNRPSYMGDDKVRSDIVDEMFRDFLAEKMELVEKEYVRKRKSDDALKSASDFDKKGQKRSKSDHEKASKEPRSKSKESKSNHSKSKSSSTVDTACATSKDHQSETKVHVRAMTLALRNLAETESPDLPSTSRKSAETCVLEEMESKTSANEASLSGNGASEKPASVAGNCSSVSEGKKPVLSLKISSASANRISSGETVKQEKKTVKNLEEGEVRSSGSENTTEDESEDDEDVNTGKKDDADEPSETGSISDSDTEKITKSKKKKKKHKHKHKHKKKKKKSSKGTKSKKKKSTKSRSRSLSPKQQRRPRSHSTSPSDYRDSSRKRDHSRSPSDYKDGSKKRDRSRSPDDYRDGSRKRDRSRSPLKSDSKWVAEKGKPIGLLSRSYRERHGLADDRSSRRTTQERSQGRDRCENHEKREGDEKGKDRRGREDELQIDKAKLRKIAIANAVNMMKAGGPGQINLASDSLAKLKAGGKSVEELTDYCKKLSERDKERQLQRELQHADDSLSDSSEDYQGAKSEEEDFTVHHPFTVKEAPNIVMNIRNSKQLPTLTPQEKVTESAKLRLTFPVSSGSQHRAKESEWVPVEKTTAPPTPATTSKPATSTVTLPTETVSAPSSLTTAAEAAMEVATVKVTDKVFPDPPKLPIDIGSIVSERLAAVRRLQKNPNDVQAITQMHKAQKKASLWAESKVLPGQFMGSTGAAVMSQQELMGPDKKRQAWARKEQLTTAAPLSGGLGMMMLQKLGWRQGEGLGKNKDGPQAPLLLDVKVDRKGLTSQEECHKKAPAPRPQKAPIRDLSGKHPVSALVELCSKRRWGAPEFILVEETGPAHKKNFLFKVAVNGVEYQSTLASNNKKQAKAQAATVCLQELGLVPRFNDYLGWNSHEIWQLNPFSTKGHCLAV